MRDQEIELACHAEEGEGLRPMRLRYGITADEASRREPLDVSLNQEEVEQTVEEDGAWDDVSLWIVASRGPTRLDCPATSTRAGSTGSRARCHAHRERLTRAIVSDRIIVLPRTSTSRIQTGGADGHFAVPGPMGQTPAMKVCTSQGLTR